MRCRCFPAWGADEMTAQPLSPQQQEALEAMLGDVAPRDDGLSAERAAELAARAQAPLRCVERFALSLGIIPKRYSRSIGTAGIDGQMRLLDARVLVVGLGGLGGHAAEQLARSGVGLIGGCDHDVFEENNLNRQAFCTVGSLGRSKSRVAAGRLAEVNPAVEFEAFPCRFQEIPDEVFAGFELVLDCLDSNPARLELENRCERAGRPLIHAAIGGWYGQVAIVWPGSRLLSRICGRGAKGIEGELGNPAFTPTVAAGLMVALGIRVLLGKVQAGQTCLQFFDLLNDEWEKLEL